VKLLKLIFSPLPDEMSGKATTALVLAEYATINAVRKTHDRESTSDAPGKAEQTSDFYLVS